MGPNQETRRKHYKAVIEPQVEKDEVRRNCHVFSRVNPHTRQALLKLLKTQDLRKDEKQTTLFAINSKLLPQVGAAAAFLNVVDFDFENERGIWRDCFPRSFFTITKMTRDIDLRLSTHADVH